MDYSAVLRELRSLPPDLRKQVADFIAFLKSRKGRNPVVRQREFGYAKGKVKINDDFDDPLDDFKDYM